jgi:hypothetical protein
VGVFGVVGLGEEEGGSNFKIVEVIFQTSPYKPSSSFCTSVRKRHEYGHLSKGECRSGLGGRSSYGLWGY